MQLGRSAILLLSTLIGMVCLLVTNKLLTTVLTQNQFGQFSYSLNFFNFVQILTSIGLFYPLSRELAKSNFDKHSVRNILGLGYVFVVITFVLQLVLVTLSYFVYFQSYKPDVALYISLSLPFLWVFSANNLSEILFQSLRSVTYLAVYRMLPRIFFLILIAISQFVLNINSFWLLLYCFFISYALVHIGIFVTLKPRYSQLKQRVIEFMKTEFNFGFDVYIGSVVSLGAVSFTGLLIGFFDADSSEIGYYNLAVQLSVPLTLLPNVIATSNYSKFVNDRVLEKKTFLLVLLVCLSSLLVMYSLSDFIVHSIYGANYNRVSEINKVLIVGYFFYGIADCFNKFLLAKGLGKEIRTVSIIIGVCLLMSNLYLIPIYSGDGAAISVVFAGIVYLSFSVYFYLNRKTSF